MVYNKNEVINKMGWRTIKIDIFAIKFCPYCGPELEKSFFDHPGDDQTNEGRFYTGKCPNCKKIKYSMQ